MVVKLLVHIKVATIGPKCNDRDRLWYTIWSNKLKFCRGNQFQSINLALSYNDKKKII